MAPILEENGALEAVPVGQLQIAGYPDGYSRETQIEISILGGDFSEFRYKVTNSLSNPCSSEAGYSIAQPLGPTVTIDVEEFDDGEVSLCMIGGRNGQWQPFGEATVVTWTKKTIGPFPVSDITYVEGSAEVQLTWKDSIERSDVEFLLFRANLLKETPLLVNGKEYQLGERQEELELVYKGTDLSYLDIDMESEKNYFYYMFVVDSFINYSEAKIVSLKTFGQAFAWVKAGLDEIEYAGAVEAGEQVGLNNVDDVLYLCRVAIAVNKMVPGQLVKGPNGLGDGVCNIVEDIGAGTQNVSSSNYEVFVNNRPSFDEYFSWELSNFVMGVQQMIPLNSLAAGNDGDFVLYICRGAFGNRPRPGKIAVNYERCSASAYDGNIFQLPSYDAWQVLAVKPRPSLQ